MMSRRRGVILALTGACLLLLGSTSVWLPEQPAPVADAPALAPLYAAPVEDVETRVMRRGQSLGVLLNGTDVSGEMSGFLLALREYMNPRRLMPGVEVTLRRRVTDGATRSVDVQLNADSVVHLTRGSLGGWQGELRLTPVERDTVYVAGRIEDGHSLFEALVGNDDLGVPAAERYALVVELAQIYSWQIDFTREIQPGDEFALMYERDVRPDGTTRWRRVLAAVVRNRGVELPAIHYDGSAVGPDYFDESGRSLKLAFNRYPLDYVRVTSAFAWRRYHPVLGRYRAHLGTDFGASRGTPVKSTGAGTVAHAGRDGGYGNLVRIRHPGGYETRYAHLSRFASGIRPGTKVEQGQVIGYVGATGLATAPHLHYEFRQNGQPQDVRRVRLPSASPVPNAEKARYESLFQQRLTLLRGGLEAKGGPVHLVRQVPAAGAASP